MAGPRNFRSTGKKRWRRDPRIGCLKSKEIEAQTSRFDLQI
jgi:hypothetical protein